MILTAISRNVRTVLLSITGIALALLYTLVRHSGKQSARQEQLQDWLSQQQRKRRDQIAIQNMPDSEVRDRLKKRWSL